MQRKGLIKKKASYPLLSMKKDQTNCTRYINGVDGGVSPPVLLVLNLTQLKSHGIRL